MVPGSPLGATTIYYATSGLFLFFVYWSWAQTGRTGSLPAAEWGGFARYLEVLCWISVGLVVFLLLRRVGVITSWPRDSSGQRRAPSKLHPRDSVH